ncbi:MAG: hypothetical protein HY059_05855 [Proteobacteria bacterium]|nr:hypothetical protein [Pseudomonadota bacterium]
MRLARTVYLVATFAGLLGTGACMPEPVQWDADGRRVNAIAAPNARLEFDGKVAVFVPGWVPPMPPNGLGESATAACPGSVVAVRAKRDTAYAAWWAPKSDSSVRLVVARSDDGGYNWHAAVPADTLDRGHAGCRRDPPYVSADTLNGYVHVVYFLQAKEGPGLFFTHSMEHGALFHEPVPVVYGERKSAASVSSSGDTLAVAYTDPNAAQPQLWLALSQTTGHIFEQRVAVSPSEAVAARPLVAVRGRRIAVSWFETPRGSDRGVTIVRTGTLK